MGLRATTRCVIVVLSMIGCGAPRGSPPSTDECIRLENAIVEAMAAIPASPQSCSSASDCHPVTLPEVTYKGQACVDQRPIYIDPSSAAAYTGVLASDPGVTASCKAFLNAGCTTTLLPTPEYPIGAGLQCVSHFCSP